MDRFEWCDPSLMSGEQSITSETGVRLYDGETRTNFDHGQTHLTSHRIIWKDLNNQQCCIGLQLSFIVFTEDVAASFSKSAKIIIHLNPSPATKKSGPAQHSSYCHIKLSFKRGGAENFHHNLHQVLKDKKWEQSLPAQPVTGKKVRAGIVGIERQIHARNQQTDQNISKAFEDLKNLMDMAKDMVGLSRSISKKIKEKQGDITEDETIRFKSYLLSLGIDDPVTKDSHGSGDIFHKELAKQIAESMEGPIKEAGGIMVLTDVYCRLNRARGLELLSPEDLLNACKLLQHLNLPICFKVFDSGVMVLQLRSHNEVAVAKETSKMVEEKSCLTAGEFSKIIGISVILANERLLAAEKLGSVCRDDSIEGLKFFPNLFLISE